MELCIYRRMAELEQEHWWFAGRRSILDRAIQRLTDLPDRAEILDAGCGTGGNLQLLRSYGNVVGMEMEPEAARIAQEKNLATVVHGWLPHRLPFPKQCFDLIVLLDVLEHIEDDYGALLSLAQLLKPEGSLIITVPAFKFLWSNHDKMHHHKRRYHASELSAKIKGLGLQLEYLSYYNTLLFPLIAAVRTVKAALGSDKTHHDLIMPGRLTNRLLKTLFALERHFIGRFPAPFGVSLIACASKK